ncbi:MAG: hypothetical protein LBT25_07305 [Candidatus Symbiothrix sp.]|nr:hypothetical protein [Candidatus Symbiothrix sp.]
MDGVKTINYSDIFLRVFRTMHKLIRENSKDGQEYKRYFGSLKSSVLTVFYTPPKNQGTCRQSARKQH